MSATKPRKAAAGRKEMLMPIAGKKPAKEATAKSPRPSRIESRPSDVKHPVTPDGRYFVVRGRLWWIANTGLDEASEPTSSAG
jgi:hypothetical protein